MYLIVDTEAIHSHGGRENKQPNNRPLDTLQERQVPNVHHVKLNTTGHVIYCISSRPRPSSASRTMQTILVFGTLIRSNLLQLSSSDAGRLWYLKQKAVRNGGQVNVHKTCLEINCALERISLVALCFITWNGFINTIFYVLLLLLLHKFLLCYSQWDLA